MSDSRAPAEPGAATAEPGAPPARADLALAAALSLLAFGVVAVASQRIDPRLASPHAANVWFDSDIPYRLEVMRQPGGWENGGAHPLFPTLGHALLEAAALVSPETEPMRLAGIGGALASALFALCLLVLFRRMGLARLDAALFTGIGATSAGALFWFPVPESYGLAGLGVAVALVVAAGAAPSLASLAAACVLSASAILTNGVVGALAVLGHEGRRRRMGRALACGLLALGAMAVVWSVQEWSFGTPFFLSHRLQEYRQHLYPVDVERTAQVVQGLLFHPVVAPALHPDRPTFRWVSAATSGPLGALATLAWLVLLSVGSFRTLALARRGERPALALAAGGGLGLMLAMHLTLGREMFLYAMDVLPLLLALAAAAAAPGRSLRFVRAAAVLLLVAGAANNARQFVRAAESARRVAAERVEAGAVRAEP